MHARWITVLEHFWTRGWLRKRRKHNVLVGGGENILEDWEDLSTGEWIKRAWTYVCFRSIV